MMLDDLHSDGSGNRPDGPRSSSGAPRPATDREVPLTPPGFTLSEAVHAWLDGDATELMARREQSRGDVDFWKRLEGELAMRRSQRPRAGFAARVMQAIRAADDEA